MHKTVLKKFFRVQLIQKRNELSLTQNQMAEKLGIDGRSYYDLESGKSCCSAITLIYFLLFCIDDPIKFLNDLQGEFVNAGKYIA